MLENKRPYSLILFVPGVNRVGSLIQIHLESYEKYDDAKAVCISYMKQHHLDARVMDYTGKVCFPYERSVEIEGGSLSEPSKLCGCHGCRTCETV